MTTKQEIISRLIDREGGYVNDPDDSGGETNFGITRKTALEYGYGGDMRDLTKEFAVRIYQDKYWDSLDLDEVLKLSPVVAEELFDTGVNLGIYRAATFFQRCLNVLNGANVILIQDGILGTNTMGIFKIFLQQRKKKEGEQVLLKALNCLQGNFYISLAERRPKDKRFIFGWLLKRVK